MGTGLPLSLWRADRDRSRIPSSLAEARRTQCGQTARSLPQRCHANSLPPSGQALEDQSGGLATEGQVGDGRGRPYPLPANRPPLSAAVGHLRRQGLWLPAQPVLLVIVVGELGEYAGGEVVDPHL